MNVQAGRLSPEMGELNVSNDLLGDHEALRQAWERDGYWFFRDVLDKDVIGAIRARYVDYLRELDLLDPDASEPRWNGKDYSGLPINSNSGKMNELKVHKLLHEAPTINAFFTRLFGCDPFWVPFTVHRFNPPALDRNRTRFDAIHDDGIYNDGLDFLICWVPLDDIDADVGGLAVAEGTQNGPSLHTRDGMKINFIREEDVPAGHWRRTHYRAGDVLLMSQKVVHSGLSNVSKDRIRFSMDTRVLPATGRCPLVGTVTAVSPAGVTLATADGTSRDLPFDDHSYVRGLRGDRMVLADVPGRYAPGSEVIVTMENGAVRNMRPIS